MENHLFHWLDLDVITLGDIDRLCNRCNLSEDNVMKIIRELRLLSYTTKQVKIQLLREIE